MANTYSLISSVTVGSGGSSSIAFTSIPATYTDLVLKFSGRNSRTPSDLQEFAMTFNNNTSSNYTTVWVRSSGSAVATSTFNNYSSFPELGQPASTVTANTFSNYEIYIPNYAGSNNKSISIDGVTENDATNAFMYLQAGILANTAAITSIQISAPSYLIVEYSTFYLYGISNA